MAQDPSSVGAAELRAARSESRALYWAVGLFSFVVNVLMLTGPLYMLNVYDRVLGSRSVETLLGLTVLVAFLFGMMGLLDLVRGRVMGRVARTVPVAARPAGVRRGDSRLRATRPPVQRGVERPARPRIDPAADRLAGADGVSSTCPSRRSSSSASSCSIPGSGSSASSARWCWSSLAVANQMTSQVAAGDRERRHLALGDDRRPDPPGVRTGAGARHARARPSAAGRCPRRLAAQLSFGATDTTGVVHRR